MDALYCITISFYFLYILPDSYRFRPFILPRYTAYVSRQPDVSVSRSPAPPGTSQVQIPPDFFICLGLEKLPAIDMVRKATLNKIGRFTKQDIREFCPSLSISSIEGSLRKMVSSGKLKREGSGKFL